MATVTELVGSLRPDENYFCCEFFPPRTAQGVENLIGRCRRLVDLGALFVSVTWATGGAQAEQTLQLATRFQNEVQVPTVLHLTCTNMDREILDHALARARQAGIRNVLALRGDPPRAEYKQQSELQCAKDLVAYIRQQHGDYFCIGVAGYPEGHADGAVSDQSVEKDLPYLLEKVQAGADFIITQLFYDAEKFVDYEQRLRQHPSGAFKTMPIIPGLMPINSYPALLRSAKLSSANIPKDIDEKIKSVDTKDDVQVKAAGVKVLCAIVDRLHAAGIRGVHFYTLNLEKSVAQIVAECGMVHRARNGREESPSSESTWDDFTNGRYSDPRSAAFGEIDGYGPVIHGADNNSPNALWGEPKVAADISQMFVRHITNELPVIPFSDQPLSAETSLIQEELIALNEASKWTLSSQPSVSGAKSTDRIFGWGPADGKVFQKAFVEFLCSSADWHALKARLAKSSSGEMIYFAANEQGKVDTNAPEEPTVVTWGTWGERTAQSTFLTVESFTSWRDEAFDVLRQWQHLYPAHSASSKLLDSLASDRFLVTIMHHDMANGLWDFLLE